MAVIKTVSNSECLLWCRDYDQEVDTAIADFEANINTADIEDTLEIQCGESGCQLRLEKYIKIVRDSRQARNGIFPAPCAAKDKLIEQF